MSVQQVRAATDLERRTWEQLVARIVARWSADLSAVTDPTQATRALSAMLARETVAAGQLGARAIDAIVGGAPTTVETPPLVPTELARTIARDWAAARTAHDPARARQAAARRIVDLALSDAYRDGMAAAMQATPAVIGWRRVAHAGCCRACRALAGPTVHPPSAPLERHPHCRCIAEPVIAGVNDQDDARPAPEPATVTPADELKARLLEAGLIQEQDLVSYAPRRPGARPVIFETPLSAFEPQLARLEMIGPDGALRRRPPRGDDRVLQDATSPIHTAAVRIWESARVHWQDERARDQLTVEQVAAIVAAPDYVVADRKNPRTRELYVKTDPGGRGAITVVVDHGPDGDPWVVTAIQQRKIQRWIREAPRRWSP